MQRTLACSASDFILTVPVVEKRLMEAPDNTQALLAQLRELNERTRWYSNRLWQEPFTFFGIAALSLQYFNYHTNKQAAGTLTMLGLGALVLYRHLKNMEAAKTIAVEALAKIEATLGLPAATSNRPGISPLLQRFVLAAAVTWLSLAAYFFIIGLCI